jgi:hypothetical protein
MSEGDAMTKDDEDIYSRFSQDHRRFGAERELSPSLRLKALIFVFLLAGAFWSAVLGWLLG